MYHRDGVRSGLGFGPAAFGSARAGWSSDSVDGDVYAAPLVAGGQVIVATENNTLYAFELAGGRQAWKVHLGEPYNTGGLPCGNILPVSGITGTPVIDAPAGRVLAVAFLQDGRHELFAVNLFDGSVSFHRTVDPPGDARIHQQRAALALGADSVYIAYGGLLGDCGAYHGVVIAAGRDGSGGLRTYQVPSGQKAGIWAPSGPALDADGLLYVSTGNSTAAATFDFNNSVIKLNPNLEVVDWFAPGNWQALNRSDADLGSIGPALLDRGLVFIAGKEGQGYLLRSGQMGRVGGQAFMAAVCSGGAFGGTAWAPPRLYVACRDGLVALQVDSGAPSFRVAWRGPRTFAESPIVSAGAVWSVDRNAASLNAYDPENGRLLFKQALGTVQHFETPAATPDGRILIMAGARLMAIQVTGP
jgi:outer membrane protein assembly factor BamB